MAESRWLYFKLKSSVLPLTERYRRCVWVCVERGVCVRVVL